MRIVAAPDKFRGTASAASIAAAIAAAVADTVPGATCVQLPLADGGEGTLEVLAHALSARGSGIWKQTVVTGPLGDPVEAGWLLVGNTAYLEMARASGLVLVGGAESNDPLAASTYGTGELISAAVASGARRVVVTVGGSATTDGGFGALRALEPLGRLRGIDLVVACDVETRFVDAASVFAPQKGASPAQVALLRRRLENLAEIYVRERGVDVRTLTGAGAAGGLAGGLASLGATVVAGFDLVAEVVGVAEALEGADLVVTGEGFLDEQSFAGKVVGGVYELAREVHVPVLVVAGEAVPDGQWDPAAAPPPGARPGLHVISLAARVGREQSMADPWSATRAAVSAWLAGPCRLPSRA